MRCTTSRRLLSRYLDEELGPWRERRLQRHLEDCASCRAEREAAAKVWALLEAAEAPPAPDVMATLEARLAGELRGRACRLSRWLVPAAYAAALLLCAAAGAAGGVYAAGQRSRAPSRAELDEYAELLGDTPPGLSPVVSIFESPRTK